MSILGHCMYKHNRRKSGIFAIVIVATAALTLLTYTSLTNSALAAKPEKRGFKNLAACELNASNSHSEQLTETDVMNCYLQAFPSNPISPTSATAPNDVSSDKAVSDNTHDTNGVSTDASPTDSSSSHASHHHNHANNSSNSASGIMNSNIGK